MGDKKKENGVRIVELRTEITKGEFPHRQLVRSVLSRVAQNGKIQSTGVDGE